MMAVSCNNHWIFNKAVPNKHHEMLALGAGVPVLINRNCGGLPYELELDITVRNSASWNLPTMPKCN